MQDESESEVIEVEVDAELGGRIDGWADERGITAAEMTHRLLIAGVNHYPDAGFN